MYNNQKTTETNNKTNYFYNSIMIIIEIMKLEPNVSLKILSQMKQYTKILFNRMKANFYHILYNVNKLENQYIHSLELRTIINLMKTMVNINSRELKNIVKDSLEYMTFSPEFAKKSWLDNISDLLDFVLVKIKYLHDIKKSGGWHLI